MRVVVVCIALRRIGLLTEPGAERARFGQMLRVGLAGDVGDQIRQRAGAVAGHGAGSRPGEPCLLDIELDRAIDPGADQHVAVGRRRGDRRLVRLVRLVDLAQLAHAVGQRPQPGAVVVERVDGRLRHRAAERVERDRGGHEAGRVGQGLFDEIAPHADRIADVDPLLGLLIESAGVLRRARRFAARAR